MFALKYHYKCSFPHEAGKNEGKGVGLGEAELENIVLSELS